MNRSSRLFQELTDAEIAAVIRSVLPEDTVLSFSLLTGGLFNTTYHVVTDRNNLVLRLGPIHPELLLPFEENLMRAEVEFDRLCAEHNIPVSFVRFCDTSHTVINRDFMLVDYLPSIPLSDESLPPEVVSALQEECGRFTRKIHSITGSKFGRLADILRGKGYDTYGAAIAGEYHALFAKAKPYALFSDDLIEQCNALLDKTRPLLDRVTTPHLVHADLWAGNILVQQQDDTYRVCAIIDGDRAYFGDTDYDLTTPWMITPDYLRGYGDLPTDFTEEEIAAKRRVISILLALTDAYVWAVEYNNEANSSGRLADALALLNS